MQTGEAQFGRGWDGFTEGDGMAADGDEAQIHLGESSERRLKRVETAHKQIVRRLGDLESAGGTEGVVESVEQLLRILPKHFASDEEGPDGLFEELRAVCPSLDGQLKALRQEHREILEALEALRTRAREVGDDFRRIEWQRAACVGRIRAHERRENHLVMDTFFSDEGGSG
jgi:hypothetical protein